MPNATATEHPVDKVALYRKCVELATHPSTPANERETAKRTAAKMREKYPGIEHQTLPTDAPSSGWRGAGQGGGAGVGGGGARRAPFDWTAAWQFGTAAWTATQAVLDAMEKELAESRSVADVNAIVERVEVKSRVVTPKSRNAAKRVQLLFDFDAADIDTIVDADRTEAAAAHFAEIARVAFLHTFDSEED